MVYWNRRSVVKEGDATDAKSVERREPRHYPDPVEEDEYTQHVRFFVRMWAEAVIRQLKRVREQQEKSAGDLWLYDHEPLGIAPTNEDLQRNFRVRWAEEHMLIWAAHQLERWVKRLAIDRGKTPPAPDPVLADVRNAMEHLDEADFDEHGTAVPGSLGPNWSLRRLPNAQLAIGVGGGRIGGGILAVEELVERALAVVNKIEAEEYAREEDYIEQYLIDELRGK
jgi:hypothetical protein